MARTRTPDGERRLCTIWVVAELPARDRWHTITHLRVARLGLPPLLAQLWAAGNGGCPATPLSHWTEPPICVDLHAASVTLRAHTSCTCFMMPVAKVSYPRHRARSSPLATAFDWAALIGILICACDSAHPQPSARSEISAKTGVFPANTRPHRDWTLLFPHLRHDSAHPRPTYALGWDSLSPASVQGLESSWRTSAQSLNYHAADLTHPRPHLRKIWAHPCPTFPLGWDSLSPAPMPGLTPLCAHLRKA